MPVRITENELYVPALRAAELRGGYISTTDLIEELTAHFDPDGRDAEILEGRHDTYFSQKVRNLVSHRDTSTSMFSNGHATYTGDGIQITDAGKALLAQLPE
jgi:hypothetical protein